MGHRTKKDMLGDLGHYSFDNSRIVANNTIEYWTENGDRVIRLHDTDIVTFTADGKLILNSGGWQTKTTKDRIEKQLPEGMILVQRDGIWHVGIDRNSWDVFQDGMQIDLESRRMETETADEKEVQGLRRRIDRYAKNFVAELQKGNIPMPGPGDCWMCCMENASTGKPLGEDAGDTNHLHLHLEEGYYVPSLLARAMRVFYNSPLNMQYMSQALRQHDIDRILPFFWKDAEKAIKKYFFWQLGMPY